MKGTCFGRYRTIDPQIFTSAVFFVFAPEVVSALAPRKKENARGNAKI